MRSGSPVVGAAFLTISITTLAALATALGIGEIHANRPASNVHTIQAANCSLGILGMLELHKGKSFGLASLLVFAHANPYHLPNLRKFMPEVFLGCVL